MKVEIVSKLNCDGYYLSANNGDERTFYGCWQVKEMVQHMREINRKYPEEYLSFVEGKNTFTGKKIGEDLFYSLMDIVLEEILNGKWWD